MEFFWIFTREHAFHILVTYQVVFQHKKVRIKYLVIYALRSAGKPGKSYGLTAHMAGQCI